VRKLNGQSSVNRCHPATPKRIGFETTVLVAAIVGVACGGRQEVSSPDCAAQDDAAVDASNDGGRTAAGDSAQSQDAEGLDTWIPPPADGARNFPSCSPYPCAAGQLCVDDQQILTMPIREHASCEELPPACEPTPTCFCIVHSTPWCAHPICVVEENAASLTCSLMPP
jgi:hypothetical protein